jgi:hypothetical protein
MRAAPAGLTPPGAERAVRAPFRRTVAAATERPFRPPLATGRTWSAERPVSSGPTAIGAAGWGAFLARAIAAVGAPVVARAITATRGTPVLAHVIAASRATTAFPTGTIAAVGWPAERTSGRAVAAIGWRRFLRALAIG